jgi:CheY-like chemotaxis protein
MKPKNFNSAESLFFFENRPNKEEPVLLFLDINMLVMDGWGLLDSIHQTILRVKLRS